MSRGGRPRKFDRDQALDVAMRLFWRNGYEGVSLSDLTSSMGIAPPSLYAAFGSKSKLYVEALGRYESSYDLLAHACIAQAPTLDLAAEGILRASLDALTAPEREAGCMVSSGMICAHPDHAELVMLVADHRAALLAKLAEALSPWLPAPAALAMARYLAVVMQGMSIQARDGSSAEELGGIVEDVVAGIRARYPGLGRTTPSCSALL